MSSEWIWNEFGMSSELVLNELWMSDSFEYVMLRAGCGHSKVCAYDLN